MPIAIDANIAIAWFTASPPAVADRALKELVRGSCVVPALWRWEVQDVLRRLERDGHLTRSLVEALDVLRALPITVDEVGALFSDELSIAQRYGITVYDAAYLELALRRRIPLATHDRQLAAAARRAGTAFT